MQRTAWGPQYDSLEKAPVGVRIGCVRCRLGACLERLSQSGDVDHPRQPPALQLTPPDFVEVLDFWFGAPNSRERGRPRKLWFQKSEPFDAEVRRRFLATWERAARGECERWQATPLASLALIVVLDQFPRNMFRGTARAFASDSLALAAARETMGRGFDRLLSPVERLFIYLPFEHAEDLAAQRRSLAYGMPLTPQKLNNASGPSELTAG